MSDREKWTAKRVRDEIFGPALRPQSELEEIVAAALEERDEENASLREQLFEFQEEEDPGHWENGAPCACRWTCDDAHTVKHRCKLHSDLYDENARLRKRVEKLEQAVNSGFPDYAAKDAEIERWKRERDHEAEQRDVAERERDELRGSLDRAVQAMREAGLESDQPGSPHLSVSIQQLAGWLDEVAIAVYGDRIKRFAYGPDRMGADVLALRQRAERAEDFIHTRGYRQCDTPACNCNSWCGGGYAEQRLHEIYEALGGCDGTTALKEIQRLTELVGRMGHLLRNPISDYTTAEEGEDWRRDVAEVLRDAEGVGDG